MSYKAVRDFADARDGHVYRVGDVFPHDGTMIPQSRIEELSGKNNRLGVPVIADFAEKPVEATEQKPQRKTTRKAK